MFKKPYVITIGGKGKTKKICLGGDNPIAIQTMWKEPIVGIRKNSQEYTDLLKKIEQVQMLGCDILRFAVPDMESAEVLKNIAEDVSIPLVADIHFDYKLALSCLDGNIAKIRINPGNIGSFERTKAVVDKARDKGTAIRVGINTGSLPKDLENLVIEGKITRAEGLVKAAEREMEDFDKLNFKDFVVSMKASSVAETIESNEKFAEKYNVPLHIGVTEAGPIIGGVVKSTLAFSHLLKEGVGSTIRVSLSSESENEVITAKEILRECGMYSGGVKIVSCPRCGRNGFDVHSFINRWQNELQSLNKDITVAVMGCVVNGPGEGKNADIGITGAGNSVIIFKHGVTVRTVTPEQADSAFREELNSL